MGATGRFPPAETFAYLRLSVHPSISLRTNGRSRPRLSNGLGAREGERTAQAWAMRWSWCAGGRTDWPRPGLCDGLGAREDERRRRGITGLGARDSRLRGLLRSCGCRGRSSCGCPFALRVPSGRTDWPAQGKLWPWCAGGGMEEAGIGARDSSLRGLLRSYGCRFALRVPSGQALRFPSGRTDWPAQAHAHTNRRLDAREDERTA